MPIDPNEAEARIRANPITPDPEAKATLIAHHGEAGYRKIRDTAAQSQAANIGVRSGFTAERPIVQNAPASTAMEFDGRQRTTQRVVAPIAARDPHDPRNSGDSTWEATMQGAEQELLTNPVGISAASKHLLVTRWGADEFKRRRQYALEASGALNMKVTVK